MKDDKRQIIVLPSDARNDFDIGFYVVGYEGRSRFVMSKIGPNVKKIIGLVYDRTLGISFPENLQFAEKNGVELFELSDYQTDRSMSFVRYVERALGASTGRDGEIRILVDVSSMDRSLMARLFYTIIEVCKTPFRLRVVYAPALFREPTFEFRPIKIRSPAIPELAGRLQHSDGNITLILGLGYEYGVALGLVQSLEPDKCVAFFPIGGDKRFEEAVNKANFDLGFGEEKPYIFRYFYSQPALMFERLYSLGSAASSDELIIIAPNGPKIFAAMATLVGLIKHPYVSILRVSLESPSERRQVEAEGTIVSVDVVAQS